MCKIIWNFNPTQSHKVAARERVARGRIGDCFFFEGSFFLFLVGEELTHLYGNSTAIYYSMQHIYIYTDTACIYIN